MAKKRGQTVAVHAAVHYVQRRREVLALLELLRNNVEDKSSAGVTWSDVGDVNHMHERLLDIAVGLLIGCDEGEGNARERIIARVATDEGTHAWHRVTDKLSNGK